MIGRRAATGLALPLALVICALAAQSASAASAINTTAFTCVDVQPGTGAFEDAHCDKKHPTGKGNFAHKELESKIGETTKIIANNDKTNAATTGSTPTVLRGTLAGVKLEISCEGVAGTGTLGNTEPLTNVHKISSKITIKKTGCTVLKPAKCIVKEPIEMAAEIESVEELGTEKNEMGLEFRPEGGKSFGEIFFENKKEEKCSLLNGGKPFNVEGTAIATANAESQAEKHHGATWVFVPSMTNLVIGGKAAEMETILTPRMHPTDNGTEKPITATTVT